MTNRRISVPMPDCESLQLEIRLDYSEKKPFRVIGTACRMTEYSGGYFLTKDEETGLFGVLDREGEAVVAPVWDDVEIWPKDGPAEVFRLLSPRENGEMCWALADTEGKLCSSFMTGEFLGFREGIGLIRTDRDICYGALDYRDGITFVDRCGKTLFYCVLSSTNSGGCYPLYHDGVLVYKDADYHYHGMDTAGQQISQTTFRQLESFAEGLAAAGRSRLLHPGTYAYGFVDKAMHWVIRPQFDAVRPFCHGYARVEMDRKWGLVDLTGTACLPLVWDELSDVREDGLIFGRREEEAVLMTPEGKPAVPLDDTVDACWNLAEGLLGVRYKNGSLRFLDESGNTVLSGGGSWARISEFHHGVAAIRRGIERFWKLIDYAGREIPLPCHVHSCAEPGLLYGDHHIVHYGCEGLGENAVTIPAFPKDSSCDTGEDAEQSLFHDSGWQVCDGEGGEQALADYLQRLEETEGLCEAETRLLLSGEEGDVFLYAFQCADRSKVTSLTVSFGERAGQQVPFDVLVLVGRTDSRIFSRLICSREIRQSQLC